MAEDVTFYKTKLSNFGIDIHMIRPSTSISVLTILMGSLALISTLYGRTLLIVTTNLNFGKWSHAFGDAKVTTA